MIAFTCRVTIDSRLLRMRRLATGFSSRWPDIGSEMGYTALGSPPSSILVLNHHRTGGLTGITGYGQMYGRLSTISGVARSTPVGGRASNRIKLPNRI